MIEPIKYPSEEAPHNAVVDKINEIIKYLNKERKHVKCKLFNAPCEICTAEECDEREEDCNFLLLSKIVRESQAQLDEMPKDIVLQSDNWRRVWLNNHYPMTIVTDRYSGVYSGGQYTCWPLDHWELPDAIEGGDNECDEFWSHYDKSKVGIGNTVQEALHDLETKMMV